MAAIRTEATITSWPDEWDAQAGRITADQIQRVTVSDAVVDPSIIALRMPRRLIRQLGLTPLAGSSAAGEHWPVRLTLLGRDCTMGVIAGGDDEPVRLGLTALTMLDLVVDHHAGKLTGNPAHGGEEVLELY